MYFHVNLVQAYFQMKIKGEEHAFTKVTLGFIKAITIEFGPKHVFFCYCG